MNRVRLQLFALQVQHTKEAEVGTFQRKVRDPMAAIHLLLVAVL